jgi:sialate O-acetylesterase
MRLPAAFAACAFVCAASFTARLCADVAPAPLFRDHAVLQQGLPLPVWGTADNGEEVTVTLAGHTAKTKAVDGRWMVRLPALMAGGPHELVLAGKNRIVLTDILIGEVWLCSGQSNMERQLGLRAGQKPIDNWEQEAATANFPQIRHFGVAQTVALSPQSKVAGDWLVCTPQTAPQFTAVGFFFGRALHQARGVPIGLIHSSWGGTPAQAWTSREGLARLPEFAETVKSMDLLASDPAAAKADFEQRLSRWYSANDLGVLSAQPWSARDVDTTGWTPMRLPGYWEEAGMKGFDGVVWYTREFDVPAEWTGKAAVLNLGAVDDWDSTWVNGEPVGHTDGWNVPRVYPLAAGLLKPGKNRVTVRVVDTGGNGGLWGPAEAMTVACPDVSNASLPLDGDWQYRVSVNFRETKRPPASLLNNQNGGSALYNGMIEPLRPYAMRGVIWYQGEANAWEARLYRTLFPAMVADWRGKWAQGDFPFLYVQIAPFKDMPPEIREAQLLSLAQIPNSAMAVTLDVGDAEDIHPTQKRPVGERLALAARALAYAEKLEYSGPLYRQMEVKGDRAVVTFTHVGSGLVAKGGELIGFEIAGADKVFHPARAAIVGDTLEVTAEGVTQPVAVRYAWANVPSGNLFNKEGLPASPFRTDVQ